MITPDAVAAALAACCSFQFARWTAAKSWFSAYICGLTLGFALLAKFTNLLFLGIAILACASGVFSNWRHKYVVIGQWVLVTATALFILKENKGEGE